MKPLGSAPASGAAMVPESAGQKGVQSAERIEVGGRIIAERDTKVVAKVALVNDTVLGLQLTSLEMVDGRMMDLKTETSLLRRPSIT